MPARAPFALPAPSAGSRRFPRAWRSGGGRAKDEPAHRLPLTQMSHVAISPPNVALGDVEKGHQNSDKTQTAVGGALPGRAEWEP